MPVNTSRLDLRLLLVFSAVMEERSVSKAAHRLGLTQSAISNALNRLRTSLEDRLFVPTSTGMIPTARALEIAGPIEDGLELIRNALETKPFDPAGPWTFNLAFSDQASTVILPPLLGAVSRETPQIRLQCSTKKNSSVRDQLDSGDIDVAIGIIPDLGRRFSRRVLLQDRYVCVTRRDHRLTHAPLTPGAFASAEHLAMRTTTESSGRMDAMLSQWGVTRKVALSVNQLTAVPALLSSTELVVCLPGSLAALLPSADIAIQPLPFAQATVQIVAAWSTCRTSQPALKWILGRLADVCAPEPARGVTQQRSRAQHADVAQLV
ncbi:MAG: putative LysR-type transcriptional regulator [Hyphomicrobiales bacterium]|nr:putative LysR-type transcriptional regulator [Hyphomicrobiales bacterium]